MKAEHFATIGKLHAGLLSGQESIEVFQAILLKANGEVSSIFGGNNSKPRGPPPHLPRLKCSFSGGSRLQILLPIVDDSLTFYCDKSIYLNGFVICNRNADIDVSVMIHRLQISTNTKTVTENETTVIFDTPIRLANCEKCNITIESEIFRQSTITLYGFDLQHKITTQDGYSFRFSPHAFFNLITRLLYSTIDIIERSKSVVEVEN